jgi:hypothetical protein
MKAIMKKAPYIKTLSALVLLLSSALSAAATVEVSWDDPKDFRDIRVTNDNKARFQARVIEELEEQFREEGEKLPADQTLHVTVHDVDLAGDIEYFHRGYPFGLRVVRNVDFPTIDLSYELTDANDRVIKSGDEKIRDLNFKTPVLTTWKQGPFRYEHQLIRDWYNTEFR